MNAGKSGPRTTRPEGVFVYQCYLRECPPGPTPSSNGISIVFRSLSNQTGPVIVLRPVIARAFTADV